MDDIDENVLNIQQRQKRAQAMRRNEVKIEVARERAKKKVAPEANIKKRAYAMARQLVRNRYANISQAEYAKMGPSEKMAIDRLIEKKSKAIKKLAMRLVPKVKKAEYARLQSYMHGQQMANHGAPEGQHVSEALNNMFVEYFGDSAPGNSGSTGERSDSPISSSGRKVAKSDSKGGTAGNAKGGTKTKGSPIVQYGKFGEDLSVDSSEFRGLVKKSDKTEIDLEILGEVYNRGLDAWTEAYNVSPTQYAFARVNSYINQGKTYFNEDADLHEVKEPEWKRDKYGARHLKTKGYHAHSDYNERFGHHNWIVNDPNGKEIASGSDKTHGDMHSKVMKAIHDSVTKNSKLAMSEEVELDEIKTSTNDKEDNCKHSFMPATNSRGVPVKVCTKCGEYRSHIKEETEAPAKVGDTVYLKTKKFANSPHTGKVVKITPTHVHLKTLGGTGMYKAPHASVTKDVKQSHLHTTYGNKNEEVELDELSKGTMTSYIKKAKENIKSNNKEIKPIQNALDKDSAAWSDKKQASIRGSNAVSDREYNSAQTSMNRAGKKLLAPGERKAAHDKIFDLRIKIDKRHDGIGRATHFLKKEEVEEVTEAKFVAHVSKNGKPHGTIRVSAIDQENAAYQLKNHPYHKNFTVDKLVKEEINLDEKRGLWDNIHAKQKRIKAGSGERMRKPGSKGAPSEADLKAAQESVEVDESKNTPYVKPHTEVGKTKQTAWKASNKHGNVKYFGLPFKKAAERHAGLSEETMDEHIVKVKGGFELKSKSTGRNLGTYPTKTGAEKREKQVQYFKHQNEEVELDEVLQNRFKKREKFGGKDLGQHISSIHGAKHIGAMENGHDVYHSYDPGDKMHDYHVVDPKTKRVNIHLTTKQQKAPGAEEVSVLTANTKSLGAHHLYKHLVTKHNKIISSHDQSPGARRVWDKVGEHKGINIHGYDPISKKSFHMKPSDDEEYVDRDNKEINAIKADRKETKPNTKDRKAHDDELEDLDKKKYTYIVMHKKDGLKEDCSCNQPQGTARNIGVSRKKTQSVERDLTPETPSNDAAQPKNPASDMYKQQQIKKKIIDSVEIDPAARLIGTDSLVKTYKKATPGQKLDEAFNIAFAAGIGQTYTAADLGMKIQGGFALHPSVVEEDVVSAERAPVVVPAHIDAYGNVIPAKTVMRKLGRKIIKSGNVHNGDTDQPIV